MLTRTSEYALQAMIHLARHVDRQPTPGREIARETGIPGMYLSKILGDLVRAGLLQSTRGKSGGFSLARSPDQIMLLEVVKPFEHFETKHCPFGYSRCQDMRPCGAHHEWKQVKEAYQSFLRRMTVAEAARKDAVSLKIHGRTT